MNESFFNSPFEVGFRSAVILGELFPQQCDLQRLVYFDYLLINSGDVPGGPRSLHPPTPFRSEEYAIRRDSLQRGLLLMASKGIVDISVNASGIEYGGNELTIPFLDRLLNPYVHTLRENARWLCANFSATSDENLAALFATHLGRWGSEFLFMRDFSRELSALASQEQSTDGLPT